VLLYKHFEQHVASEIELWEGGAAVWVRGSISEHECSSKNPKTMKSFVGLAGFPLLSTPIFVNSLLHIVVDLARK
jgi:hypothetical protein